MAFNALPYYRHIKWDLEITTGLSGVYLVASSGNKIITNLLGTGGDLTVASGATFGTGADGRDMISTAASGGAGGALGASQQPTTEASVFWRGRWNGVDPASPVTIAGAIFDSAGASPFDAYNITKDTTAGLIYAATNVSGTPLSGTSTAISSNVDFSAGMSVKTGSTLDLYISGLNRDSFALSAGTITYSGPQMNLGYYSAVPTRISGMTSYLLYTWSRALKATEHAWLDQNPYGIFVDDDYWIFKAAVTTNVPYNPWPLRGPILAT